MDSYFPLTFNRGYYAVIPNIDTNARPWSNYANTYLMPTCKVGDKYYMFFGYGTTSPYSYQNQGAYSCDAYKSSASNPKMITPVYTSFLDKLKNYYGIPLPEYQNMDGNARVKPVIPLIQKSAPSGSPISTYYEPDWANTIYTSESYINTALSDTSTSSYSVGDFNIINPISVASDDSSSGDTSDYSGIIGAITLIPATLIVIAFFTVIFKMFVNRRTRG